MSESVEFTISTSGPISLLGPKSRELSIPVPKEGGRIDLVGKTADENLNESVYQLPDGQLVHAEVYGNGSAMIAVVDPSDNEQRGTLRVDVDGKVTDFEGKSSEPKMESPLFLGKVKIAIK